MSIIRGQVDSGGGRTLGTGFTATHNGEGNYTVTFETKFAKSPVIVATALGTGGGTNRYVTLYNSSATAFSITTWHNNGKEDTAFNFYASDNYSS